MWSDTPISLRISQFVVIHTVKSFSFKETDVFLGLPHFLYGLMNIDNSTSCSSVSLKPSLFIWKLSVHVHQTLLSKWDTSMAKHHYCFGLAASILLELLIIVLFSSPAGCWTLPTWGVLIFHHHIFLPFHTICGVLQANYWSGLPFPSPVDHVLSKLFTMTHLSWVALHGMAHSFIELHKPFHHKTGSMKESKKLTPG